MPTIAEVTANLTAPGAPFEIEEIDPSGHETRARDRGIGRDDRVEDHRGRTIVRRRLEEGVRLLQ